MQEKNEVEIGEWNRLVKDAYNSLEFLVTMHYLSSALVLWVTLQCCGPFSVV